MTLHITGSSGFVGQALSAHCQAANIPFRAIPHLEIPSLGPTNFTQTDSVIHLAGMAHRMGQDQPRHFPLYSKANVDLSLHLARQARDAGVKRFIYVSTIKVNGEFTLPGHPFSHTDAPNPHGPYAESKLLAEHSLAALLQDSATQLVVVRPPLVYGGRAKGNLQRLMGWLQKGRPLPLGLAQVPRSMVAKQNLVALLLLLAGFKTGQANQNGQEKQGNKDKKRQHKTDKPVQVKLDRDLAQALHTVSSPWQYLVDAVSRADPDRGLSAIDLDTLFIDCDFPLHYPVFMPADCELSPRELCVTLGMHLHKKARLLPVPPLLLRPTSYYTRFFRPYQVDASTAHAIGWQNLQDPDDALKQMVLDFVRGL